MKNTGLVRGSWGARVVLALTLVGVAAVSAPQAQVVDARVDLAGSVPQLIRSAADLGPLDPAQVLNMTAVLKLPDRAALDQFVSAQYTPGTPQFRSFVTPSEFGRRFGASTSDVESVALELNRLGFQVAEPKPNHLLVDFSGSAGTAEEAFGVSIHNFRLRGGGRSFFANTAEIRLTPALSARVDLIVGLSTANIRTPQVTPGPKRSPLRLTQQPVAPSVPGRGSRDRRSIAATGPAMPCSQAKPESGGAYVSTDFAGAYDFTGIYSQNFAGDGMNLALVEFDDYHTSAVQAFESCYGFTSDPVVRRTVLGGSGPPAGGEAEDLADIDTALEMLPALSHLYVYVAPNTDTAELDLYNDFVNDQLAPVMSSSWGSCEPLATKGYGEAFNTIAEESAAQGDDILEAAGDSGSVDCRGAGVVAEQYISVEAQAAVPYTTGIGGTNLTTPPQYPAGATHQETTWNDDGAGGGGISSFWPMPTWESAAIGAGKTPGVQNSFSNGSFCNAPSGVLCREVPDISANADLDNASCCAPSPGGDKTNPYRFPGSPGYAIYCPFTSCVTGPLPVSTGGQGGWVAIGGTSLATPLTAAFFVLVEQMAKAKGLYPLGFLNPAIYRIAADPTKYANDFFDITTDANDMSHQGPGGTTFNTGGRYPATTGYDLATGWGSYDAAHLATDILADTAAIDASPSGINMYGYLNGPVTHQVASLNSGVHRVPFTVSSDSPWLTTSITSGTTPASLTLNADPTGAASGTYTGHLTINSNEGTTVITVSYAVSPRASLSASPLSLSFSEDPNADNTGTRPAPSCTSSWDDEFSNSSGSASTDASLAKTQQTLTISNTGPSGSVLHWAGYTYTQDGGGWFGVDLQQAQSQAGAIPVPTEGSLASGQSASVQLVSVASAATLYGGLPLGVWHGAFILSDLADPSVTMRIPAKLTLGDGSHTPTIAVDHTGFGVTLPPGGQSSVTFTLSDSDGTCGYDFSTGSNVPWLTLPDPGYSTCITPTSNCDSPVATAPITAGVNATGLAPGRYFGRITVSSVNAEPQPFLPAIGTTPGPLQGAQGVLVVLDVSGPSPTPSPTATGTPKPKSTNRGLPNTSSGGPGGLRPWALLIPWVALLLVPLLVRFRRSARNV